jgi:hypothetical protein
VYILLSLISTRQLFYAMKSMLAMVLGAMVFSDVWAVYGIGVEVVRRDATVTVCTVSDS